MTTDTRKYIKYMNAFFQSYFYILTIVELNYIDVIPKISKYQMKVLKLNKLRLHFFLTVNLQCSIILPNKLFFP